ncbi:MAG: GNAT family N-acetyltransferase [Candidatus Dormibacteraceae bacterium]
MSRLNIRTERLLLRRWRQADRGPFAEINADPEVMLYFPAPLSRDESDALVDRIEAGFSRNSFGLWALEVATSGEFIGFTGLAVPNFEAAFTPAVEIGWRLAQAAWGKGYATEAARAVLGVAFDELGLAEVVSFTSQANTRSRAVMHRIGMIRDCADDFDHPRLAPGHPLARHVLYRKPQMIGVFNFPASSWALTSEN